MEERTDMNGLVIIQQMGVILLLVLVGYFLQRAGILDAHTQKKVSFIVANITNPCLVFSSVLSDDFSVSRHDFLLALAVAAVFYLVLVLIGFLFPRALRLKDEEKYYNLMVVYTNVGFLGLPIGTAILPPEAVIYIVLCNVMFFLFFYTHGLAVLRGEGSGFNWKKFLNPGIICSLLTIFLFWFNLRLPAILERTVSYIGNANVFLAMILLGASLATAHIRENLKKAPIWLYCIVRLVAVPVALSFVLKAMALPVEMTDAFCLMAMMPAGNLPLVQAEADGLPTGTLSGGIVVSTIFSFFSITILMSLLF